MFVQPLSIALIGRSVEGVESVQQNIQGSTEAKVVVGRSTWFDGVGMVYRGFRLWLEVWGVESWF